MCDRRVKEVSAPKMAITMSEREVEELKMIVADNDKEEALKFIKGVYKKVAESQRQSCGCGGHH